MMGADTACRATTEFDLDLASSEDIFEQKAAIVLEAARSFSSHDRYFPFFGPGADELQASTTDSLEKSLDSSLGDAKVIALDMPKLTEERKLKERADYSATLAEWDGVVSYVGHDTFHATIKDVRAEEDVSEEQVELPVDDVADIDKSLLKVGGMFRWVIGYSMRRSGKERISRIVFRKMPMWRKQDLEEAYIKATDYIEGISWE